MPTESEQLFEQFCADRGITAEKLATDDVRTPDYAVTVDGNALVVEVKQFDPKDEEAERLAALKDGEVLVVDDKPGARVRAKIAAAAKQMRALAKGVCPAVVVLYNNQPFMLGNPASPYNVRVAMYGFETIVFTRGDGSEALEVHDRKFGPGKKLTESHNTTVSAVGVLKRSHEGLQLDIYHNRHAAQPLPIGLLGAKGVREFVLSAKERAKFQEWEQVA